MRLELFITDLLFRHDCVIVPDFGAFITRSLPAEITQATHMFRPARKQLAFNGSLRENDGLLIGYVSRVNKLSFEQARLQVQTAVTHWRHELAQGKRLRLEHIGQLYHSQQGAVQFIPSLESNFDLESYGHGIFHLPPIEHTSRGVKELGLKSGVVVGARDMSPEKAVVFRRARSGWRWAAVLAPVIILSAGAWWKRDNIGDALRSRSSIGPTILPTEQGDNQDQFIGVKGLKRKSVIPFSDGLRPAEKTNAQEATPEETEVAVDAVHIKRLGSEPTSTSSQENALPSQNSEPISSSVNTVSKPVSETPTYRRVSAQPAAYYIIVGSFREQKNTARMISRLQQQGFNDARVAPGGGLARVSAAHFSSQTEALEALQRIKSSVEAGAWIYRP